MQDVAGDLCAACRRFNSRIWNTGFPTRPRHLFLIPAKKCLCVITEYVRWMCAVYTCISGSESALARFGARYRSSPVDASIRRHRLRMIAHSGTRVIAVLKICRAQFFLCCCSRFCNLTAHGIWCMYVQLRLPLGDIWCIFSRYRPCGRFL